MTKVKEMLNHKLNRNYEELEEEINDSIKRIELELETIKRIRNEGNNIEYIALSVMDSIDSLHRWNSNLENLKNKIILIKGQIEIVDEIEKEKGE